MSVIPVCPVSWSPKSHQRHWRSTGIWKGLNTLCGQCPHGLRARTTHAYTCWWAPSYSQCSSWYFSVALSRVLVWLSATPQIWTNSWRARHRRREYDWWLHTCTLLVMHIKLPWVVWTASTPFHLLYQVLSSTSIDTLLSWRMTMMERVPTIFFAWYKYVDTCRGGKIWIKRNQSKSMWYY